MKMNEFEEMSFASILLCENLKKGTMDDVFYLLCSSGLHEVTIRRVMVVVSASALSSALLGGWGPEMSNAVDVDVDGVAHALDEVVAYALS